MNRKYTSEAILISAKNSGEADKIVLFITKRFGLLKARALGVRYAKSKLRYHLTHPSLLNAVFVRGRAGWRVVEVIEEKYSFHRALAGDRERLASAHKVFSFLPRVLVEEEFCGDVYSEVADALPLFADENSDSNDVETLVVFRILRNLGYIKAAGDDIIKKNLLAPTRLDSDILKTVRPIRRQIIVEINKTISENQL